MIMKKQLLLILMMLMPVVASAHDIAVKNADGVTIYYNYINDGKELEVTYGYYTGNIVIPEEVTYMNRTRKVTSIGDQAFDHCYYLASITIPNSVTSIGRGAFFNCSGLTSVNIPNSVTSIGDEAFFYCSRLTSVTIGNSVTSIGGEAFYNCYYLASITIPNSVTSIDQCAFYGCSGLTSVTIGNSVTSIGDNTFYQCIRLTSVTIPNSVTSIGQGAFYNCSGLTSVTIGNSVTSIGQGAFCNCSGLTSVTIGNSVTSIESGTFYGCSGLTSVTIPNNVTIIGQGAFCNCSGLTSVTIGNSVTSIGENAFDGIDIPTVISLIENPFTIIGKTSDTRTFSKNTFINATLYVPKGTIDKYKATEGWKDFVFIEESGTSSTPEKCEKPTIGYRNGNLTFTSSTEGATCYYSITDTDIKAGNGNEVQLTVTYNISVYAAKEGFENSETATATLCWIDAVPQTEGIMNGVAQIAARPVLIKSDNGFITVEGIDDRTNVNIYTTDGKQVGSAISQNNVATIATSIQPGSIAIVKIGDKSVKVVMK
jgi:hypothetical protein